MDATKFTSNATGRLVRIEQPRRDWAFIPDDLPPKWDFSPELWPLLVEAKETLGTLNGIGQVLPDPQLLLRPLQSREAITSSNIEGTYVTPEQLLLYQLDPREPRSGDEQMADWLEVFNYGRALEHAYQSLKSLPFCNRVIREMHGILMHGVRGRNKSPGEFRKWQVQIGSSGRFIPPPASEVDRLMGNLEQYINSEDERYDPLVRCFLVHYQFESIHPFVDGNGRVGRALLALMVYKWLGHAQPWLYMSAFYEQFKDEYVGGLFRISTDGDWTKWVEFCLRGAAVQASDSIRRCHLFKNLREQFHAIAARSPRTHTIIEQLFTSPILTIGAVQKRFKIAYQTARADLEHLADVGILKEMPDVHPRSFFAPEIMRIAYRESDDSSPL